jgi:hypothetical protein
MNATTNEARLAGLVDKSAATQSAEATRYAENSFLTELPGLVFGLLTLGYLISSLLALA